MWMHLVVAGVGGCPRHHFYPFIVIVRNTASGGGGGHRVA